MKTDGRVDGVYTLKKDFNKKQNFGSFILFAGDSYVCSEIIDGIVKIFVTKNHYVYISLIEFYDHFYYEREMRRKKIEKINKKVGLK